MRRIRCCQESLHLMFSMLLTALTVGYDSPTAAAPALGDRRPAETQVVVTGHGPDHIALSVSNLLGASSVDWLALRDVLTTSSRDPSNLSLTIYVAIPDCDGVDVECRLNGREPNPNGNARRRPVEKLARVVTVSRLRDQSVAIVSLSVEGIRRLQPSDEESLQLELRFRNPRGPIYADLGPMKRLVDGLLVRDGTASIRSRAASRPITAGAGGQVTWATGSSWQQAMQSAIDANTDYLMIMADELSEELVDSLAFQRATFNELNVTIVKMSQIDATPDAESTPITIRNLIKGVYDSRSAAHSSDSLLSHVLLIGDAVRPDTTTVIPSYYGFAGSPDYFHAADSYYSFLSEDPEDDVFPDVFLGRLPVDAASSASPPDPDWELRNVVHKICGYQQNGLLGRKLLLISGGIGISERLPYRPYFASLIERLPSWVVADSMHREEYPDDNDPVDGPRDLEFSERVADRLNTDEYGVFGYFDHGNPFILPESFYAQHYDTLQTVNSLPLALLYGTDIGRFDLPAFNTKSYVCLRPASPTNPWEVTPATELDSCDVVAERLLLQEHGAIGSIAMSRTADGQHAPVVFTSMMRALFEENAFSLGEILLATRMLMYPNSSPDRNLTLFGDPALNIMWENGVSPEDTVDLSISASHIRPLDAIKGKYVTNSSVTLAVGVENKRTALATSVAYEVWEGQPGTGTLKASSAIAEVPGFNHVAWDTITVSGLQAGIVELFVQVDTTAYPEPTYFNNIASRKVYAYDYEPGFPVALNDRTTHSVTLADIRTNSFGKEILVQTSRALRCFSVSGQSLWQVTAQQAAGSGDVINGTPLVASVYKDAVPYTVYLDGNQGQGTNLYIVNGQGVKVDSVAVDPGWFGFGGDLAAHATSFVLADLVADDDALELITVSGTYFDFSEPKHVRAYSIENHSLIWETPIGHGASGYLDAANIAVGDIDLDGNPEVLVRLTTTSNVPDSLYCIRSNGNRAWVVEGGRRNLHTPYDLALAAATGEQLGEMSVLTIARDVGTGSIEVIEVSSSGVPQTIVAETAGDEANPVLSTADIDGNGALDVVIGFDSTLAVYEVSGGLIAERSDVTITRINPLIADVNGDGLAEVIVVHGGKNWNAPHESVLALDVMSANLEILTHFVFPFRSVDIEDDTSVHYQGFGGPAIGDIDDDGVAELAFVSLDSVLHVIALGQMGPKSPWPQRYGNPMQTNVVVQPLKGTYNVPVSLFNTIQVVDDVAF